MTRMMAPDGSLGMVPEENVQSAVDAGFRVMTSEDMKAMYNSVFMQHLIFKDKQSKIQRMIQNQRRGRRTWRRN